MEVLRLSGLEEASQAIHVTIAGEEADSISIKQSKYNITLMADKGSLSLYEFPTLFRMQQYCQVRPHPASSFLCRSLQPRV